MTEAAVIQQLTHLAFSENVGTRFLVSLPSGEQTTATILQVSENNVSPLQEQFSVVFRGPLDSFLPQGMHKLTHRKLGSFDLFLVPIGRDSEGYSYEAVFNRAR